MLLRIWRTGVDPARWPEYEHFEQEYSLPMFRQQPGCRGVLFVRAGDGMGAAACSFWDDQQAIEQLRNSPTYQGTVARLLATGLLTGEQSVRSTRWPAVNWIHSPEFGFSKRDPNPVCRNFVGPAVAMAANAILSYSELPIDIGPHSGAEFGDRCSTN